MLNVPSVRVWRQWQPAGWWYWMIWRFAEIVFFFFFLTLKRFTHSRFFNQSLVIKVKDAFEIDLKYCCQQKAGESNLGRIKLVFHTWLCDILSKLNIHNVAHLIRNFLKNSHFKRTTLIYCRHNILTYFFLSCLKKPWNTITRPLQLHLVEYPTARWQHFLQNFLKDQPKTFESKQKFSNWQRKRIYLLNMNEDLLFLIHYLIWI